MKYRISFVRESDYCILKPSDPDCHYTADIIASSKGEAVLKAKEQSVSFFNHQNKSACPVVWEIIQL